MSTTTLPEQRLQPVSLLDWREMLARIGPLIGLLFVFGLFAALSPRTFLTRNNVEVMLTQTAVVGTAALGMTLIIISGGIDLSVGSAIALCTVVIALLLPHRVEITVVVAGETVRKTITTAGLPASLAALGSIATGALVGLITGLIITRLKLLPFIVTLGTFGALRGAAKGLSDQKTVNAVDSWLNALLITLPPDRRWMLFPPGVWIMLILAVLVWAMLRYTRFGRHIFAIGSNEQTARLCGVAVERTKTLIYVLGTSFVGIAGILQYSFVSCGDPTTAKGYELSVIAAVVIGGASLSGGQGSVIGSLIGALIMTIIDNGCNKVGLQNWVQEIVTGCIIIIACALDRLRQRRT